MKGEGWYQELLYNWLASGKLRFSNFKAVLVNVSAAVRPMRELFFSLIRFSVYLPDFVIPLLVSHISSTKRKVST
jgi:hypothetical protein